MTFDLDGAVSFVAAHGRVLDRRRLGFLLGAEPAAGVVAAVEAYRNGDGGFGWGLEPDLRSRSSQPVAAMHALEVFAEVGDAGRAAALCDWLGGRSLGDGGVPFALPFADAGGSAPHWAGADPRVSSLQMTSQLVAHALRLDLVGHPWLVAASEYCLRTLEALPAAPSAYELLFSVKFLDAAAVSSARARRLLERYTGYVRTDGPTPVEGSEGEVLFPLDFTPSAGAPSRELFTKEAVAADLERLAGQQQADGGWVVTFPSYSAAAALEWRAYATVQAVLVLTS
ncbi:hypothetical protein AB0M02_21930 [Actinoplanes sp. NPDC051861]|uniref:hypothetical protein n=1 Tax=Actinoplanes sp. NPDC051861 TaxID=3155170 RepID=UPI0034259C43